MSLNEQIYAQAALMAGQLDHVQTELLKMLCNSAENCLRARLRPGLTPEDCKPDFIAAASLFALASLNDAKEGKDVEEFRAGDLTVRSQRSDTASRVLHNQAELMIMPYLRDRFSFTGV